jgi:hypothetical protein
MSAFQYEQLNVNRKTVRLLRVLPGRAYSTIECELHHADLDDKPNFVALSYTWDLVLAVRTSSALGSLRRLGKISGIFFTDSAREVLCSVHYCGLMPYVRSIVFRSV